MGKELSETHHKSPFCSSMKEKEPPSMLSTEIKNAPLPLLIFKYLSIYIVVLMD